MYEIEHPIENDEQALTQALALAIVAPSEEQAKRMTTLAEAVANGLDELTVERCKKAALARVEQWEGT